MPISAAAASPGPLTAQPITATVIFFVQFMRRRSTSSAMGIRSMRVRPQVGQAIRFTPSLRSPAAFRIFLAAKISSIGSAVSVTRMVSPIPRHSRPPIPMADFTSPMEGVPASVTPRCKG